MYNIKNQSRYHKNENKTGGVLLVFDLCSVKAVGVNFFFFLETKSMQGTNWAFANTKTKV